MTLSDPTQNVPQIPPGPPPPAGIAESSRIAYQADARAFEAHCASRNVAPYPAERGVLLDYLDSLLVQGFKLPTVRRHAYAIRATHRMHGIQPTWDFPTPWSHLLYDLKALATQRATEEAAKDPLNESGIEIGRSFEREAIVRDLRALAARDPFSAKGRLLYQLATRYETGAHHTMPAAPNAPTPAQGA